MPSPVGHALGGIAAGWLVRGRPRQADAAWRDVVLFAAVGTLADLDLLFGAHSGPTHGLGAALVVGAVAWAWGAAGRRPHRNIIAVACACAYASHTLLDWLGTDTAPPIGIMALWPLTREYYQSDFNVFMGVSRRIFEPELFWMPNLRTLVRELVILLPVVTMVSFLRRRT